MFVEAIVDVGDDPRDQVPLTGFRRIYTSRYYAVYAQLLSRCTPAPRRRAGPGAGLARSRCSSAALALRCGASRQGLPYAYNADEADHFVPRAVAMFEHAA